MPPLRSASTRPGRRTAALVALDRACGAVGLVGAVALACGGLCLACGGLGGCAPAGAARVALPPAGHRGGAALSVPGALDPEPGAGAATAVPAPALVSLRPMGSAVSPRRSVAIEYRLEVAGALERVQLWSTADGGQTWTLSSEDIDCRSPVLFSAPDGDYGLRLSCAARGQSPLRPPGSGDPPQAQVAIDTTPPGIQVGKVEAARDAADPRAIAIRVPFEVSDPHADPQGAGLEWRAIRDRWIAAPAPEPVSVIAAGKNRGVAGEFAFVIPEPSEDPLYLRLSASDLAGNASTRQEEVHVLDMLEPPQLELLSFNDGATYRGGISLEVRFRVEWPRLEPGGLSLSVSTDGGRAWQEVARGLDPGAPHVWTLPSLDSEAVLLELAARGRCGFRAVHRSRPFRIDSQPPLARVVGPRSAARRSVRLQVWARDVGPAGLELLTLYASGPAGKVIKVGDYPPSETIEFEADRTGEIGLWLVGLDRAGNSGKPPAGGDPPSFTLVIDSREPPLGLDSFNSGGVYRGGSRLYIFLRGDPTLTDRPMTIRLADGEDGRPRTVAEGLGFRDRHPWQLPQADGEAFRLLVEVVDGRGESLKAVSAVPFSIDSTPPEAAIESVEGTPGEAVVRVRARDALAGVASIQVWTRPGTRGAGGEPPAPAGPWQEAAIRAERVEEGGLRVLHVPLHAGRHGLFAAAEDRVGNRGGPPAVSAGAQASVEIPASRPPAREEPASRGGAELALANFHGGAYRGGDRRYVFWTLRGVEDPGTVIDIFVSGDGGETWDLLQAGVPAAEGRWAWTLPREPGQARRLRLRLQARTGAAQLAADSRADFLVDSRLPRARFLGPRVSRLSRTSVRYALVPPEGAEAGGAPLQAVERVECHVRGSPSEPWSLAGSDALDPEEREAALLAGAEPAGEDGGPVAPGAAVPVTLADGRYEVFLVAVDAAGNRTPLPAPGSVDPGRRLLVDTVTPPGAAEGTPPRGEEARDGDRGRRRH